MSIRPRSSTLSITTSPSSSRSFSGPVFWTCVIPPVGCSACPSLTGLRPRQALIDVIEEADNVLSRKATFLIGEVLALANRLLPGGIAADAQVRVAASLQHARQLTLRSHLFWHRRFLDYSPTLPGSTRLCRKTRRSLLWRPSIGSTGRERKCRRRCFHSRLSARGPTPSLIRCYAGNGRSKVSRFAWAFKSTTGTFRCFSTTPACVRSKGLVNVAHVRR